MRWTTHADINVSAATVLLFSLDLHEEKEEGMEYSRDESEEGEDDWAALDGGVSAPKHPRTPEIARELSHC
jgi:hypothetical protein